MLASTNLSAPTANAVNPEDVTVSQPTKKQVAPFATAATTGGVIPVLASVYPSAQAALAVNPENANKASSSKPVVPPNTDEWVNMVKGRFKKLEKKGTAFTLPSGEACVKIPNSVIENNKKGWESFIIGQFYSDPPAQNLIHNIVNGIWSKRFRDITVSKLEGNAFLIRIPNASTRERVLYQRLWQIEGQTMFVANWEPGVIPLKPELSTAPIWLELRGVPFQFFNEEGLERIAGLVGHPQVSPSSNGKQDDT